MIRVLDAFVADKIAAGEVIERPVSAVKELVENSIDAGSSSIIVEIRNGGKSYIRVTDDGCGIPADEAETAFLRHATSKISRITDLDSIMTLGFRGEALASIAAVSKITLVSRTQDSPAGVRLMMHGGKVISNERYGANTGTTIVAEDLFYNTPARRKFMKTDAREASAVIELVQQYAVCRPDIRFMMINNGTTVFTTKGDGDTVTVIRTLYPDKAHSDLIRVSSDKVGGYISDPGTTMTTKRGMMFYVNGRTVNSSIIESAVINGYSGRIFSGYPVAILFIETDPQYIDVNIHPGKREIRFFYKDEISESISSAISDALQSIASVPKAAPPKNAVIQEYGPIRDEMPSSVAETGESDDSGLSTAEAISFFETDDASGLGVSTKETSQSSIRDYLRNLSRDETYPEDEQERYETEVTEHEDRRDLPFDFADLTYCGYVFNTYIIMQAGDDLYFFDQHAAHERIFYEKYTGKYMHSEHIPQPILTPFTLNVSADVYYRDRDWMDSLTEAGYDISDFGANTFLIRAIPAYMTMTEARDFAVSFCESLDETDKLNSVVIDKLIMKSCKSAVKGGDRLSRMEIDELIRQLSLCANPYACPHGRPVFIRISKYEIEKSFRRIV